MLAKITYSQAANPHLVSAFQRLATIPMNLKLSYDFMKLADEVMKVKNKSGREYVMELLPKFAKRDEAGNFVKEENVEGVVVSDKEGLTKAEEDFGKTEVTLTRLKLSLKRIDDANIKISPAELKALEPILIVDIDIPDEDELTPSA